MALSPNPEEQNNGMSIGTAFTISIRQVGYLSDLQQTEQRKKSEIVRDAIDLYYQVASDERLNELRQITGLPLNALVSRAIARIHHELTQVIGAEQSE